MAVYTHIGAEEMAEIVTRFGVGELVSAKGIAEGVENSNYLVDTSGGRFILTVYEKRVDADDLPFFLSLLDHLAAKGCPVPRTMHQADGAQLAEWNGKKLALIEFLPGISVSVPTPAKARAVGEALGAMHLAAADFPMERANTLGPEGWYALAERCGPALDEIEPGLRDRVAAECGWQHAHWPAHLPRATIHADLFPDNVLMTGDRVGGMIDFYFACNEVRAWDLAVTHIAWSFPNGAYAADVGDALIAGYEATHGLSEEERAAFPILARGACLRFLLTRAWDWLNTPADALVKRHDPLVMRARLDHYEGSKMSQPSELPHVIIATDGACKGNPGPGGWGAVIRMGAREKEVSGGEPLTTNNRMELMAAIRALEALKRPCRITLMTDSVYVRDGITKWIHGWRKNGWRTADRKPVKNAELWQELVTACAPHRIEWQWVKGHAGHAENERADRLASDAALMARGGA